MTGSPTIRGESIDVPGHLFTEYFLTGGIRDTPEWREIDRSPGDFESFRDGVAGAVRVVERFCVNPNEAVTEQELIRPVLELLGWADYLGHGLVSSPAIDMPSQTSRPSSHLGNGPSCEDESSQ